jgi:hypothetical protein
VIFRNCNRANTDFGNLARILSQKAIALPLGSGHGDAVLCKRAARSSSRGTYFMSGHFCPEVEVGDEHDATDCDGS